MTTPADYTPRADAYVATCPSPAVAYAVILTLMLDYDVEDAAVSADVSVEEVKGYHEAMRAAMSDNGQFTEAAQEALRAALKRRVEA